MPRPPVVSRLSALVLPALAWVLLAVACLIPLGWLVWQVVGEPAVLRFLQPDRIRWDVLARTTVYAGVAATIAVLLAVPAGLAVGLGRGWVVRGVAFLLPVTLLIPSMVYAYGWAQFFRLVSPSLGHMLASFFDADSPALKAAGVMLLPGDDGPRAVLVPAGWADVGRCVWALATWLWPIPAGAVAFALRRADPLLRQQALLDGAAGRLTVRQVLAPLLAAGLAVWALAGQEFAVYEPTGISVVATEVRQVFETGSFSSAFNPITQPMGGGGAWTGGDTANANDAGGSVGSAVPPANGQDLQQRAAAAAVATAVPMLLLTLAAAVVLWLAARRWSAAGDELADEAPPPPAARRGWSRFVLPVLAIAVIALTVGVPGASMVLRHHRPFRLSLIWAQHGDLVLGSFAVASLAGVAALAVAVAACRSRRRWAMPVAVATFLVGGQILAVALLRIYNRPGLRWAADAPPIMVAAYLGRFGWIALMAAGATWSRPWVLLRQQAAVDGADAGQTARHVVGPLAWPLLLGGALLVLILSLTEVPATVLATPHRPPQIVPMLMTWVHILESDPMIEASLLLASTSVALAAVAVVLVRFGMRVGRGGWSAPVGATRKRRRFFSLQPSAFILLLTCLFAPGCGDPGQTEEIWMSNGTGPGQTVYPRAIAFNTEDDTFFVVDRIGRVQHLGPGGKFLSGWQMPESQQGKPVGLSVGPDDGLLYVPDTHYHRVMVYAPDGRLVRKWGELGTGPGQFIYPTDVAFDAAGRVFVSEYGEHDRVQVFDAEGKFLFQFGSFGEGDGQFSRPQSMVIDGEFIYIADACNHRLCVFKTDGTFVRNIGGVGSGLGQFRFPYGLAMDPAGRLVVCEFGNNRVQFVDKATGQGIKTWGVAGREPGHLAYPWAVAVDKLGRVIVVDAGNNRLQVFSF